VPLPPDPVRLLAQARAAAAEGHYLRQLDAARRAVAVPGAHGMDARLEAVEALVFLARYDEAEALIAELLRGEPAVVARAAGWLAYAATLQGQLPRARQALERHGSLARDHGRPVDRFLWQITWSRLEQAEDRPLAAISRADAATALARDLGVGAQCTAAYHTGYLWLDLGVVEHAAAAFARGLALPGLPEARLAALHVGACIAHRRRGDLAASRQHGEQAVALHVAGQRTYREGVARLALSETLHAAGDHPRALREARQAIARVREGRSVVTEMEARLCLAKLLLSDQELAEGRAQLEAVLASPAIVLHAEARVLLAEQATSLADPHVRALQEAPESLDGAPQLQARAAWTLATLSTRVGAHDTAQFWFARFGEAKEAAGVHETRRRYRVVEIREQVKATERERTLREAAEAAEAERRDLMELVAHDLRNPLSALLLMLDSVDEAEDPQEVQELVQLGQRSAAAMRAVLDEALATSGSIGELRATEPVDLHHVVQAAVGAFAAGARAKGQVLQLTDAEEVVVDGVVGLLRSVVDNLLSNALKFTPRGGVVRASLQIVGAQAVVVVADNGPGLPTGEADSLFERRVRGTAQPTAGEPSTGLGLYLVRKVVEGHGGTVTAHSDGLGTGARFVVRLPRAAGYTSSRSA